MGWADAYIKRLQEGETVQFRPRGNSMRPLIQSGDLVTVEPVWIDEGLSRRTITLFPRDIVLCRVSGRQFLHLVKSVGQDFRFQIANARGHVNGWTTFSNIFGRVTRVE